MSPNGTTVLAPWGPMRPNGGGASMATTVPQNQGLGLGIPVYYVAHHGMKGGVKDMAIGGFFSGRTIWGPPLTRQ
ncbi:uncharacterized protein J3R85_020827 [Psidium guajava]|nr:uncharacterized protein J3R85_020827 [Psidium guajava]